MNPTSPSRLRDILIPPRLKLSALWVAVMFLYVYVDVIAFYKPGTIDGILRGTVWEFDISQGWAVAALSLMAIPALMIPLTMTLPVAVARLTNLAAAAIYIPVSIFNVVGESWMFFYWLGAGVEVALLVTVVLTAARWPRLEE